MVIGESIFLQKIERLFIPCLMKATTQPRSINKQSKSKTKRTNPIIKIKHLKMSSLFTSSVSRQNATALFRNKREYKYSDKEIKDLLNPSHFSTINLRPEYQRHIRWNPSAMNKFIDSVMNKRYIMPILTYRLQETDLGGRYTPNTPYKYEVMDGQHRLYTLNAFRTGELCKLPHVKKEFIVHWVLEQKDENEQLLPPVHIFYEKTEKIENWCKENGIFNPEYLTEAGRDLFDETVIKVTTIVSKLTMNERRIEFLSLQNGVPVRNSDLLKNEVGCRLMVAYNSNEYENKMINSFLTHCTKKADKYITQWMARCYLLFKSVGTSHPSETFLIGDKAIAKRINESHSSLNPSSDEFAEFDDTFSDFVEFLSNLDELTTFNPTQMFALFYCICEKKSKQQYDQEILLSHMQYFSKEGTPKHFQSLWESKGNEVERRRYFNTCLEQIRTMITVANIYDDRKTDKKLKKKVWNKCVDNKCEICLEEITEKTFEAGHIIARAKKGRTNGIR